MSVWYCPTNNDLIVGNVKGKYIVMAFLTKAGWMYSRKYLYIGEL